MNIDKKIRPILMLGVVAGLVFAGGIGAMLAQATAVPTVSTAASSTSPEPTNQDSSHDLIYANGHYFLFYVSGTYVYYVSSADTVTWSSPTLLFSADGVNQGQAFSAYYNATSNVIYWVIAGGGLTSFVIESAVPSSTGTLHSFTGHTYSDGLGYAMNQPSITFDSLGNTIVTYEGAASGKGVNVVVDRIAHGTTALTNLANVPSLPPGQTGNDWDGTVYPYGSGVGSGGAFVLVYSSLHSGGGAISGTTSVWSYLEDYTGSAWLPVVELTTYQEVTHGNGFVAGNAFYYFGQARIGSEGDFYTHTYNATTPPAQTVIFPNGLGITDGYGSLSWDGQNSIVAYYNSGVASPYTVWVSVSTNLGSSWTSPAVIATSQTKFAPETLGTNLVMRNEISNVYWGIQPSPGPSTVEVASVNIALIAPTISVSPTTIDSGQSALLSTATSFSGGNSPYTCQWLAEPPGGSYLKLGASFDCNAGDTSTASTGTLSAVGVWSFELQVTDSIGISATSSAVVLTTNTALMAPAGSSSPGTIDRGQSSSLTSTAVSTGTSPYTYQWYEEPPGGAFSQIAGATSASDTFSTTGSTATGTWSFELQVADATGSTVTTSVVTVSVNPALVANAITPSSPPIDSGQPIALTAHASGGTTPYTYQWYSGSSASCSSDTSPLSSTTSTQSVSPTVNTYYCYAVTDSVGLPSNQFSGTDLVTVNSALTTPTTSAASPIDSDQTTNITVSWSGGTPAYAVTLYAATSADCSGTLTQVGTAQTGVTGASTVFTESPAAGTSDYCASVTDSASVPITQAATSASAVTVNSQFTGTAVTVSPSATIDSGQSVTLTVTWSGAGTSPYSVQLTTSSSASCASPAPSGSPQTGLAGTHASFTVSPTSTTFYCATVTDSASTPEGASTMAASTVTLRSALSAGAITPSSPTIDSGQSVTLTASPSGGTNPYSYSWWATSDCSTTPASGSTDSGTYVASPTSTATYYYLVTDSSRGTPAASACSTGDLVTVNPTQAISSPSGTPDTIDQRQTSSLSATFSGGTAPYTCQWLIEAPGGDAFSNFGDSSSCTSPGSASFGTTGSTTAGTYNFKLQVTDAASIAVTSSAGSVTVNAALGTPIVAPSTTTIDDGQAISVAVTWTAGTPDYGVNLYSSSTSTCRSDSTPVSSQTGLTASPATFTGLSPSSTLYYCATVTDSADTPVTTASSPVQVTVNPALSTGSISPSSPTIDSGQEVTLTANPSGGTTPYSYQWYTSPDCSTSPVSGAITPTYSASPSSTTTYYVGVTDSAGVPASACSPGDTTTVNSLLSAGAIAPSSPTIDRGQSVTLTASPSGGTAPYSYQWYFGSNAMCSSDTTTLGTAATQTVSPTSNTYYCYSVTDSASSRQSSATDAVTVSSFPTISSPITSVVKIDSGQTYSYSVTATGGVGPYGYAWSLPSGVTASSGCNTSDSACAVTSTTPGAYAVSVTVNDTGSKGAGGTWPSSSSSLSVDSALSGATTTPSSTSIDPGQSVTVQVSWSGGTTPYSITLYSGASSSCASDTTVVATQTGQGSSPYTFSGQSGLTITSNTYFCASVTDSGSPSESSASSVVEVTVDTGLSVSVSPVTIDSGQTASLTAAASGGSGSYSSYAWYQGAACSGSVLGTAASYTTAALTSTTEYCVRVTDSLGGNATSASAVTVNSQFTGTAVTVSPSATIDSGQSVALTVTWSGAGTSPYSVQLTTSSSASCASPAPSGSPQTGLAGTHATFTVSPTSTTFYCATVTDNASTPEGTAATSASQITVSPALAAPSISTTTPAIDIGQTASFSASWTSSGTSPYTVTLYYSSSSISCTTLGSQIDQKTGQSGSPVSFSESGLTTGTDYVCATLKDSATPSETTTTPTPVAVTVNPAPVAPVISVAPTAIDSGQGSTLSTTASFSGGTPTYACQWLEAVGAGSYSDLGSSFTTGCTASSSPTIPTSALTTGMWSFELQVTDSGNPALFVTSNVVTVTVNAALSLSVPSHTVDSGQSATLAATASGGSGSYSTYAFYSGSGCTGTPLQSSSSNTYSTGALTSTATYCAAVTDSLGGTASTTVTVTVDPALSVSVSPVAIDSGQTATLTAVTSGGSGGYTYAWYQGAACSGSVLGTAASYTTAALISTTTYCISVKDSLGGAATTTSTVTVNPALSAGAITPSSPTIDSGQSIALASSPSGGTAPYSYQWYTSSGCATGQISGATGSTYLASPVSTTSYYYKVTDSAYSPVSKCSLGDSVTVHAALVAGAVTPSGRIIDSGQSITLTAHASGGTTPYTYQWYTGSSATCSSDTTALGTASTQSVSPASSTYYCYKVTDATVGTPNSVSSSTDIVTVNPPLVAGSITPSGPTIDNGQSVTLSSAASGGTTPYTYQWYTGASCNTAISGKTASTYAASPGSTTTFSYKVTDAASSPVSQCSSGDIVTVNPALSAGAITPSSPTIDNGQSITLSAHASGGITPYSYKWYSGASATCSSDTTLLSSTTSTQSVNPTASTYYCYSVTDSSSSPSSKSSSTDLVTVHSALTAGAITPSAPTVAIGQSVTLTAHASSGTTPYHYQWYSGSSATCSSDTTALGAASTQSVNPTTNTYYCYKVSDSSTGTPVASATSAAVQVTVTKATTTTKLACSSPVIVLTPSTCTVTVSGAYGSTNGETVAFSSSGQGTFSSGATCTLSGGTCSITYTPTSLSGSPQTITATYSGDTNNAASSGKASIRVT